MYRVSTQERSWGLDSSGKEEVIIGPGGAVIIFIVVLCGEQGVFDCKGIRGDIYIDEMCCVHKPQKHAK